MAFDLKLINSHALNLKVAVGALEVQQRYVLHYGARDFDSYVSCQGVFYGHFRVSFFNLVEESADSSLSGEASPVSTGTTTA